MESKVDAFFTKVQKWQEEMAKLRAILLDCGLAETLKWGCLCYTFKGRNIVLIHGFKRYCALLFFKGALLKDESGILIQQTKNVQAARQIRFTGTDEIEALTPVINAYIHEAIEVEKAGLEVKMKKTSDFAVPEEFRQKLDHDPDLETAFDKLTPGRQRGYLLHFAAPKQSKTRVSRIERCREKILKGRGLNDR